MTGSEKILLALARHHAGPFPFDGVSDIEFDAPLWRAALRLEREGAIQITQRTDGLSFCAALVRNERAA